MRLIALGCAITALALALVAGGIAFHRGQRDVPSAVEDHRVSFNDVLKISGTNTEVVTERGVVPDPSQLDPSQPDPLNDPAFDTIKRIDDTHYEMPRRTVDHLFAGSLSGVVRSIRIAPAVKNGVAVGFKLFAIRPGSAFAKLGFLNGDLVRRINNDALTTLDEALDIYVKARSADQFTIELERRGYPLFLHVVVR